MTVCTEKVRTGTFPQFKDYTLAVAGGERKVDPNEPKIWIENHDARAGAETAIQFTSQEAGAGLPARSCSPSA
jgi:hypothetical protein